MHNKTNFLGRMLLMLLAAGATLTTMAQSTVVSPCPEVLVEQKYDHIPYAQYRFRGWDTVVTCTEPTIELSAEPYIPVQYFTGTYTVEQVPYNPPDTTFYLNYNATLDANNPNKKKLAISNDDDWAPSYIDIAYPFYFFGIRKSKFILGDNGIVTFATPSGYNGGGECPYATTTALPWPSSVPSSPTAPSPSLMRDAIYGVYEDTYTGANGSYMSGNQGIYYGVLDEYPCRKIIASWNQIPVFADQTNRQTYQIVCYEGSNIIEVHIKRRGCCSSTNGGNGLIGIQNATGQPQVTDPDPGSSTHFVVNGSPAAFYPAGRNPFTAALDSVAYRFTPQGRTNMVCEWYRIFDDGRDSVPIGESPLGMDDTNAYAYCQPIDINNPLDPDHPTRTTCTVRPRVPSKYVIHLKFKNANNDWYNLYDTVFVGIDTANTMKLRTLGNSTHDEHQVDVCQGSNANLEVSYPASQAAREVRWYVYRVLNGQEILLPESSYVLDATRHHLTLLPDPQFDTLPHNKIDTILTRVGVTFVSGCENHDSSMVRVFPNFDTTEVEGICQGETFVWHVNNQSYTQTTNTPVAHLQSQPGCDSTVHLDLTVFAVSHTMDVIDDCKPLTWINGKTYEASNTATMAQDTIVLPNLYGCDSVVQLQFTYHPLEARIHSSLDRFDFDHLDAVLTDVSIGDTTRRWIFPSAAEQTTRVAYYSIPVSYDSAEIFLIATSPYECIDTARLVLLLNKESFWVPNAFMPENPDGNNTFGSVSLRTIKQEMLIYNRQGQLVFQCNEPDCQWDGRDKNGNLCPQGAYVYLIRFINEYDPHVTQVRKGTVTLIR